MNNSGKTLTIFLSVISVLMISVTAIAVFLLMQEVNERRAAEYDLEQMRVIEAKLRGDFTEVKKKVLLFEKKNKEADEKIESLLEDLELEQGLREEVKKENRRLQEARDTLEKEKVDRRAVEQGLRKSLSVAEGQVAPLKEQFEEVLTQNKKLAAWTKELENKYQELKRKTELKGEKERFDAAVSAPYSLLDPMEIDANHEDKVELEKIVVNSFKEEEVTRKERGRNIFRRKGIAAYPEMGPTLGGEGRGTGRSRLGRSKQAPPLAEQAGPAVSPAAGGAGRIISVDSETNFIIVNLGANDGVQIDAILSIYRQDRHLGDVKVSRVLPGMSAADFIPPLKSQDVREDDRAVISSPASPEGRPIGHRQ